VYFEVHMRAAIKRLINLLIYIFIYLPYLFIYLSKEKLSKQDGTASQSSTYQSFATADKAVDGNYNQHYSHQSCTHNRLYYSEWWKFTFNYDVEIQYVVVYSRSDSYVGITRMVKAEVEVYFS